MTIKRIVKLTFRPEAVQTFLSEVFEPSKARIRAFPGCLHMELLQQADQPNVLFTLGIWENEAALARYRESELFQDTWKKTKALFGDRASAWTVKVIDG
jgi:quinol monooxygenase YgiN